MAIFDHERKNGIQLGTVNDECMECKMKHRFEEDYESERLDYKPVYKFWVNNLSHCMCLDCFKESLGPNYVLIETERSENAQTVPESEEKPKAKKTKKKEDDKNGSETA